MRTHNRVSRRGVQFLGAWGAICLVCAGARLRAEDRDEVEKGKEEGRLLRETVYEGAGFAGVDFGDSPERVEEVMGEATGGSYHEIRYLYGGVTVRLRERKVIGFSFSSRFRGKLFTSELGVGATLEEVESAYGELVGEREVKKLTGWTLDGTLLVRRGGPGFKGGPIWKLCYNDAGICFFFDEQHRVSGFGVNRKTGYADRFAEERDTDG